jgi:hypothetical protein
VLSTKWFSSENLFTKRSTGRLQNAEHLTLTHDPKPKRVLLTRIDPAAIQHPLDKLATE